MGPIMSTDSLRAVRKLKDYMLLWSGQTVSQVGSAITSFAFVIWVYEQTQSPLSVALLAVCIWTPGIVFGVIAGSLSDRIDKKTVMLVSDSLAAVLSVIVFALYLTGLLAVWHIYVFNILAGLLSCLQRNAYEVVQTVLVPRRHYVATEGMRAFSSGASDLLAPLLGATLYVTAGMGLVMIIDLASFLFAAISLAAFVKIPTEMATRDARLTPRQIGKDLRVSKDIIGKDGMLMGLMVFFCLVNLLSGITYFGLLAPMVLGRTGGDAGILAWVNTLLGAGMVCGGIYVTVGKKRVRRLKVICIAVGASFLGGDILLALGTSPLIWCVGAFLASLFIPMSNANESYLWRTRIPYSFQGRVFSNTLPTCA